MNATPDPRGPGSDTRHDLCPDLWQQDPMFSPDLDENGHRVARVVQFSPASRFSNQVMVVTR